ncbi:MAG: hypothetical protein E7643_06335 [Ruminococcaceae bacterium]|nr:hypothetical protein [Oscillospiraceae bacterium]
MGLFKKRYEKNVSRDNEFLKKYAVRTNGLLMFTEHNEAVTRELNALKDDFQYTVATSDKEAKALEKKITENFEALATALEQPQWEEEQVLLTIKVLRRAINEISSLRS